ncbi:MAG: DUF3400 domain-containing protein [Burkholderiaceae bacterium]|nr:DUF3400 domain-containing protein [Burkholderiaceae bacterium]
MQEYVVKANAGGIERVLV